MEAGNHQNPVILADENIARNNRNAADPHGHLVIHAHQNRTDARSVAAAEIDRYRHRGEIGNIAHAAIHYDSGAAAHHESRRGDGARNRGVSFPSRIEDQDVPGLRLFRRAVVELRPLGIDFVAQVFAVRQVADGPGSAHHAPPRVERVQFVDKVLWVALAGYGRPGRLQPHLHQLAEQHAVRGAEPVCHGRGQFVRRSSHHRRRRLTEEGAWDQQKEQEFHDESISKGAHDDKVGQTLSSVNPPANGGETE